MCCTHTDSAGETVTSAPPLTAPQSTERPPEPNTVLGWLDAPPSGTAVADRLDGGHHAWLAAQLDRTGVDLIVLGEAGAGPDPLAVAPLVASVTERLAVVVPIDVVDLPPWMAARALATLDHLAAGRVGWYLAARGLDETARGLEYVDLVRRLWGTWDPDALVMDRAANIYVDHTKVRPLHFAGRFYSSRGPLNTLRPPQGAPPLVQPVGDEARAGLAAVADALVGGSGGGRLAVVTPVLGPDADDATAADGTLVLTGSADRIAARVADLCGESGWGGVLIRPADATRRTAAALVEELVPALRTALDLAPTARGHLRRRLAAPVRS
jgi:hypothetical protein